MKITLTCQCCKTDFVTEYKFRDKKFCSRNCYFEHARNGNIKTGKQKDPNVREVRECLVCNNKFEVRKKDKKTICSHECRVIWGKKPEIINKRIKSFKKTNIEKYGVEHVWMVKEIHQKTMENRDREKSNEKQKNTVRKKYLNELLPKLKNNNLLLLDNYTCNKDGNTSKPYTFKCLQCDNIFTSTLLGSGIIPKCTKCFTNVKNNKLEIFITDFLNKHNISFITNTRKIISPKELDIYIPKHKLGIEINGLYWHGELNGKYKNYHLDKTKQCFTNGVELIHFSEDDILNKGEIVLSIIKNKLGLNENKVYARKCVIKTITNKEKEIFMEQNHLGGGKTKDSVSYGLFYGDLLVSSMSFSKRKITKGKPTWEISRFASKMNYNVVGGFSKLFKNFIKEYKPNKLISYVDLRLSSYDFEKSVYHKNGMKFDSYTPPNYWYFYRSSNDKKYHRYSFRKNILVKEGFDPNKTEWQIMQERGFDRIWDCGNIKFIYEK